MNSELLGEVLMALVALVVVLRVASLVVDWKR
jgi:hypothetical protein